VKKEDAGSPRLPDLIDESQDVLIATDRELNIISWSKTAEALFGWTAGDAVGPGAIRQLNHNIFKTLFQEKTLVYLTENGYWSGEETSLHKDGSLVRTRVSFNVLWDKAGNFNGIVAAFRPLPAENTGNTKVQIEKQIEQAVQARTDEILKANHLLQQELSMHKQAALLARESEGKNRDLVDNIKLGIFRCTPGARGKFLEVNQAMEEITGYSREELLGLDIGNLSFVTEEGLHFNNEVNPTDWKATRELYIRQRNGKQIIAAQTILAIRFESGAIQFYDGILEDITERKQAQEQVQKSLERLKKTIKDIIQAMAYIGEVKDPYTAGHQRRVARLSTEICKVVHLDEERCEGLSMAATVHDIGKILVPADILSKPGKLTKPEFDMLKDHTTVGFEILKNIEFPWPIANIVLQHHERINGSGYPSGLSGEQISLEARILAVADVVEAMSSHRPYRPALGIQKALEEISDNRGTLYDAMVVDACISLFVEKAYTLN
jgi:PAS domain S-box-containing protein/putative nucleotidyltransferase with HDIG domain